MVSGTNITLPSSNVVVMGGGPAVSMATVTQPAAGQTVVEVHAGEAPGVQWQVQGTSDVSEFLRKMNAERMHLEQQVGREEETAVHKLLKEQVRLRNFSRTRRLLTGFHQKFFEIIHSDIFSLTVLIAHSIN